MIPKIIHYCWFGKNPKPEIIKKCIDSWHRFCPDYQIIEWNESNFDVAGNRYVKEAYESKKWAFVSDYVRLYVLYKYGGIYLDTDCEVLKNLDIFLNYDGVVGGYEEDVYISTATMFSEKENKWIKTLLDYYCDRPFILPNGKYDLTTNTTVLTVLSMKRFGFNIGDNCISFGNVKLYPSVYFAPLAKSKNDALNNKISSFAIDKDKTYCIHHGTASWYKRNFKSKFKAFLTRIARTLLGHKKYTKFKAKIVKKKFLKSNIS